MCRTWVSPQHPCQTTYPQKDEAKVRTLVRTAGLDVAVLSFQLVRHPGTQW